MVFIIFLLSRGCYDTSSNDTSSNDTSSVKDPVNTSEFTAIEKEANWYALSLFRNVVIVCKSETGNVLAIINKVYLPKSHTQPVPDLLGLKILKPDSATEEKLKRLKDGNELMVLDEIYKLDEVDRLNGIEFQGEVGIKLNNVAVKNCDTCDWFSGGEEEERYRIEKRNGVWDYENRSSYPWSPKIPFECPGLDKLEQERLDKVAQKKSIKSLVGKMVSIPTGSFMMGSNARVDGNVDEEPVHLVNISAFNMMETEVTFTMWDTCVSEGGCSRKPGDEGRGRGERPVINVSYDDITTQFIPWLKKATGQNFRLPSEAEWEYAARAGSTTHFSWGDSISCSLARYGRANTVCGDDWKTVEVKSFAVNAFGLYDMHGNVWEWTQDCWNKSYLGAPSDGRAWTDGNCAGRMLRGGSWYYNPSFLRSAKRYKFKASDGFYDIGFRLVQDR